MDIKLIAVDLDGTLLNNKKEVPAGFVPLVETLYPRGIRFVIASGRQYFNLTRLFAPIADKLFFFSENGGLVFDGRDNIFSRPLPSDKIDAVYHAAEAIPATAVLCGIKSAYLAKDSDPVAAENVRLYYEKRTVADNPLAALRGAGDAAVKIAVFDPVSAEKNCEPHLKGFRGMLKVSLAGQNWVDVMRLDVNKGIAIDFLQKRLGIDPEQCMAFGDYLNDLEMLRQVHYSFAMENAHPNLAAAARFKAPSNENLGVMQVLREYFPSAFSEMQR